MYFYDESTGAMYIKGMSDYIPESAKGISAEEYDKIISNSIPED